MRKYLLLIIAVVILLLVAYWLYSGYIERKLNPLKYEDIIYKYSDEYKIDSYLIMAIIRAESSFKPDSISRAGAKGLMQLTDETAVFCAEKIGLDDFDLENVYEPDINIRLGTWYIKWLLEQFDYHEENALASYNAGIGNVRKWLKDEKYSKDGLSLSYIPYEETRNYVVKVKKFRETYRRLYS